VNEAILCVDDEPNMLAAYERQLRKQFRVETAAGGEEGLAAVAARGPFAVVLADMRMPRMSGVEFLARVRQLAPYTVRMMLTGNTDQQTAVAAVNEGHVFRFLTKPCPPAVLARALAAGVEQYRLVTAERELLEETLRGSVKVLTEVLALANPLAFGRAGRVQRLVRRLAEVLQAPDVWQLEVAAMLSQVGCVAVPEAVLSQVYRGGDVAPRELGMFEAHPRVGHDLIRNIPRLEAVAEIIAYQEKRFDGKGPPGDARGGPDLPLGARVLKVALDYDNLLARGHGPATALEHLLYRTGWYDPGVLDALGRLLAEETLLVPRSLRIGQLECGMVLDEDVIDRHGRLLVSKGQEITEPILRRLDNFALSGSIPERVRVLVPCPDGA
jgi:response regulator RpfG family c-di-GMP phosphodiesterase